MCVDDMVRIHFIWMCGKCSNLPEMYYKHDISMRSRVTLANGGYSAQVGAVQLLNWDFCLFHFLYGLLRWIAGPIVCIQCFHNPNTMSN